jgi:ferredoxin
MSQKDGKSILIDAKDSKGFFTVRVHDDEFLQNYNAAESCPVNIIHVKKI